MDSRVVSREIKRVIWPLLKAEGFTTFSTRTAWRYDDQTIDIVNFQSFNSYLAQGLDVTAFSYAVNLSTCLRYVPPTFPVKYAKNGMPIPEEASGDFRGSLSPSRMEFASKNHQVWSVDSAGSNLAECISDVATQIPMAMGWFGRLKVKREVLRLLLESKEQLFVLWGFGNFGSPHRNYLTGYVALDLGEMDIAEKHFQATVQSGYYARLFTTVEEAIQRAGEAYGQ
jgi:hypothetical protein